MNDEQLIWRVMSSFFHSAYCFCRPLYLHKTNMSAYITAEVENSRANPDYSRPDSRMGGSDIEVIPRSRTRRWWKNDTLGLLCTIYRIRVACRPNRVFVSVVSPYIVGTGVPLRDAPRLLASLGIDCRRIQQRLLRRWMVHAKLKTFTSIS